MLRNYQHNIKQSLVTERERHYNIMVQMPTGTGKKRLPASVICIVKANIQQRSIVMPYEKVVIVACYVHVEINENGIAILTIIPGKEKTVDLGT